MAPLTAWRTDTMVRTSAVLCLLFQSGVYSVATALLALFRLLSCGMLLVSFVCVKCIELVCQKTSISYNNYLDML